MYSDILKNISPNKNKYSHELIRVCVFDKSISRRIGDRRVYISEFVLAKILGYVKHLNGHPDVDLKFLLELPRFLKDPNEVLMRTDRPKERYVICGNPSHRVVLGIKRNNNVTEINTIHRIRESTLNRLRVKCKNL